MANRPYPSFLIYIDAKNEFRWRLQASNTEIVADSGEGYQRLADCERGIAIVRAATTAPLWETEQVAAKRR